MLAMIFFTLMFFLVALGLFWVSSDSHSLLSVESIFAIFCLLLMGFGVFETTRIHVVANTCVAGVQEVHPDWTDMTNGALLDAVEAYKIPATVMTLGGAIRAAKSSCFSRLQSRTIGSPNG